MKITYNVEYPKGVVVMRNKQEMLNLIVNVAKEDERIRAVMLTGSRANPNAPEDDYQDYDISYFVTAMEPFINNMEWIEDYFGKPAIMQMPELMTLIPTHNEKRFTYLMLFEDGNRIDLSIKADYDIDEGEPAITLLDKDGLLPSMSASSDKCWHIEPPTRELFSDCCNEFWWCLGNVGKGIGRDELPYAMTMLNCYVRNMLNKMLEWHIGVNMGFSVSSGKHGKYFKRYLSGDLYEKYARTYSGADYEQLWVAVFTACDLFHAAALQVAGWFSYDYDQTEENAIMSYLNWIQSRCA